MDLKANIIARFLGLPISNSFIASIIAFLILAISAYIFSRNVKLVPGPFQNLVESIIEFIYNTAKETVGNENKVKAFFPLVATFFLYILCSNWLGLTPIFGTIGFFKGTVFTPLFRPVNSDLNSTLSMALISAIATQYFGIKYLGLWKHLGRYFSFNPLYLFVGLLELIGEFTKIISLSLRLYGNIVAGDAVITTFASMAGFIVPLPFMGLEVIVGFVQAAIFAMLTVAFMTILTSHEEF